MPKRSKPTAPQPNDSQKLTESRWKSFRHGFVLKKPNPSLTNDIKAPIQRDVFESDRSLGQAVGPNLRHQENIILLTDSYKMSHFKQYPPKTETIFSYFESRKGAQFSDTVFFGLQQLIQDHFVGERVRLTDIDEAELLSKHHFGNADNFNRLGWEHIVKTHHGRLPLSIRAVPEGTPVPTGNVLMTVENTDPSCFWLTNYVESLLTHVWYGSTVATQSREMKKLISKYLYETSDHADGLAFALHDFGFRGVSSLEQAGIGGAAHLLNFKGTDNLAGIIFAQRYYRAEMPGHSVPAAEHSTITSWGKSDETAAYANMLTQYPTGLVSIVADSYDLFSACKSIFGGRLKAQILNRDGTLVIRPDSGVPKDIVLQVHEILGDIFGYTTNSRGYSVLNPKIKILQGDGIDHTSIEGILSNLKKHKWSTESLVLGSGGGLLQKINRDTQRFAFKASWGIVDGEQRDIFKAPSTDAGKTSKKGRLKLIKHGDTFCTVSESLVGENQLLEVFRDGYQLQRTNFSEARARARIEGES